MSELLRWHEGGEVSYQDGIWRAAQGFRPSGFSVDRREHLAAIEGNHFWFPARSRLLSLMLDRVDGGRSAIELGCGSGSLLPDLTSRYDLVVALDAYEASLQSARRRTPSAIAVQADACKCPLADAQFDLVVACDVLEHLEAAKFLAEARRLVRGQGWLLLSVPAFPSLWSALDEAAGHRVRYRRKTLSDELERTGWRIDHWTHYQAALFPIVFLTRRFGGRRSHVVERQPPAWLSRLFGSVNELEVGLFGRRRLSWGSSLLALARAV